jgi:hypothetical protein
MKKFLFVFIALMGLGATSQAQTTAPQKTTSSTAVVKKEAAGVHSTKAVTLPVTGKAAASTKTKTVTKTTNGAPVRADGSPDMRYKANKEAAKASPKLKKDGTPDKRYKQNKKQ